MIDHHTGYPESIRKAILELAGLQKTIYDLREHAQNIEKVIVILAKEHGLVFRVACWATLKQMYLYGEVDTMQEIAVVLRELGKFGYNQTTKVAENPTDNKREYILGRIRCEIGLKGTICKYVKVGEETIVQPLYELRCEEKVEEAA